MLPGPDASTDRTVSPNSHSWLPDDRGHRRREPSDVLARWLTSAGLTAGPLRPGQTCPEFLLPDKCGRLVNSSDLLRDGPVVLSFYQGEWCAASVAHLLALDSARQGIEAAGAALVVVTPEPAEFVRVTLRRYELNLRVLCDLDHALSLSFGILFRVPSDLRARLLDVRYDVPLRFGVGEWMMPVQSTFVIEASGVIAASQTDLEPRAAADPWPCLRHLRDHR